MTSYHRSGLARLTGKRRPLVERRRGLKKSLPRAAIKISRPVQPLNCHGRATEARKAAWRKCEVDKFSFLYWVCIQAVRKSTDKISVANRNNLQHIDRVTKTKNGRRPRKRMLACRVPEATAQRVIQAAREDGRPISSLLAKLIEKTYVEAEAQ